MIIQCPDCASRYRIKEIAPGHAEAHLSCPKCKCRFSLIAPVAAGAPPTLIPGSRVLVVDDALFFREMLADLLQPLHLNLRLASTAAEALELVQENRYTLLLLDLNLPDKNGLDLIGDIRAVRGLDGIRILAMSGVYRREDDGRNAIRAGADDFLNKSFRPEELRDKVRKLLSK